MTGGTITGPKIVKLGVTRNLKTNLTKIDVTLILKKCFIINTATLEHSNVRNKGGVFFENRKKKKKRQIMRKKGKTTAARICQLDEML